MGRQMTIADITHPKYDLRYREWQKWRLTYHGGPQFIEQYLQQFSARENYQEFLNRKKLTYCPSFAAADVDEVKNSIYAQMADVTRYGGSDSYKKACAGEDHGVDLLGNTMNSFMGQHVLPELLVMGRVGVYVDMPPLPGETVLALGNKRPYIYLYETEDIRSWTYDDSNSPNEFGSLLLRDYIYVYDEDTGLPKQQVSRFRHYWIDEGEDGKPTVWVQFYSNTGQKVDQFGKEQGLAIDLGIPRIPFVILEITDSLMRDLANYQIALLNIESSDLAFILKANFPFYTEQFDPRAESSYLRTGDQGNDQGQVTNAQDAKQPEVKIGITGGRRYPAGVQNPPAFIHPSSEPLKASMEKQDRMKESMRLLLGLGISNLQPRVTSAQAKGFDERSVESGLNAIGLELETAERLIGFYWDMYENKNVVPSISYPTKYSIKSDEDRLKEADQINKLIGMVSSKTYQREMAKRLARTMLQSRVSEEVLLKIDKEIDNAPCASSDWQAIASDVQAGLVDPDTASRVRGYPDGTVEKAQAAQAKRLAMIAESQGQNQGGGGGAARGNPDTDTGQATSSQEKELAKAKDGSAAVRGKGDKPEDLKGRRDKPIGAN